LKPFKQAQKYLSPISKQAPPFSQGSEAHLLSQELTKNEFKNIL
jgi:hypothetical protein